MRRLLVVPMLVALFGACDLEAPPTVIRGYLVGSQPIDGATVKIFELDENGDPVDLIPEKHGILNPDHDSPFPGAVAVNGEFEINVGDFSGPFLLQATGGQIKEYWHASPRPLGEDIHTNVVVQDWYAEHYTNVTMSPLTEIAYQLARSRYAEKYEPSFLEVMRISNRIIEKHVQMYSEEKLYSISRTRPSNKMKFDTAPELYAIALHAFASVAHDWESRLTSGYFTSRADPKFVGGYSSYGLKRPPEIIDKHGQEFVEAGS
ncbi:MAG: hypothetical protein MJE77_23050 [Proteobacteria bacterium]|nr:hypothetical protein [Pseudomonadota bacterium]